MSTRVGFTGTQRGMTTAQLESLASVLWRFAGEGSEFHHGDCIGADAQAHECAVALSFEPVIHPPENSIKRAWKEANRIEEPRPYLVRNRAIVAQTDILVAAPGEPDEQLRSGTWSTVRHAQKLMRQIYLILPSGRVDLRIVREKVQE